MATLTNYNTTTYPEAVTKITAQYQRACRDDETVAPGFYAVMDLLNVNREMNQGEG